MKASKILTIATLGMMTLSTSKALSADRMINGTDNRRDVIDVEPALKKLAQSTAVLVGADSVKKIRNKYKLSGYKWSNLAYKPIKSFDTNGTAVFERDDQGNRLVNPATLGRNIPGTYNLCADEPFQNQVLLGHCSGVLVSPDTFVTAGHCIENVADCANTKIVFDYNAREDGSVPTSAPEKNVYSCKSIVSQALNTTDIVYEGETYQVPNLDYAVIKLDRPVTGREPAKVRASGQEEVGQGLIMIGGPLGLATKVDDGAEVAPFDIFEPYNLPWFFATTDSYGGNSGSAVFNKETGEVEGLLVRGGTDLILDEARSCVRSYVCEGDTCASEQISRASQFIQFLEN